MPDRTIYLETFGCQMNELDSELVAGQLTALGYRLTSDADAADVVLYNTCSVRDLAEQKVRSRLGEIRLRKANEPGLVVGVLGCMAERDGEDLIRKFPVVDVLCGPAELDKLPGLLDNAVRTRESLVRSAQGATRTVQRSGRTINPTAERSAKAIALQGDSSRRSSTLAAAGDSLEMLDLSRAISPSDHDGSAYVRITRGCNKFCTYCVVPHTRGAEIHRPPDHIIDECKRLADAGIVEVTLLGQTVNHYRFEHGSSVSVGGIEQPQKGRTYKGSHHRDQYAGERVTTFADLLRRIHEQVPEILRLRFVTSYPHDFGNDVLEVMRDSERICRYLHIPAQSGSNDVLKRMNRGYTVEEYLEFIDRARHFLDEPEKGRPLMIAGDMIVGFCGETEEDFRASIDLLHRARYKNCFIFKYSPRPGTTAFDRLADDVSDADKRRRCNELLGVQHEISGQISGSLIGSTQQVFVQGISEHEKKRAKAADNGMISLTVGGCGTSEHAGPNVAEREAGPVQMTGRTDGDLIVVFDCPDSGSGTGLVGKVVPIEITKASSLTLFGSLVNA